MGNMCPRNKLSPFKHLGRSIIAIFSVADRICGLNISRVGAQPLSTGPPFVRQDARVISILRVVGKV